jgi:hypothetical protein
MLSDNNDFQEYIVSGSSKSDPIAPMLVNGFRIYKPSRFKNLAHERAFEIALVLASKKPYIYTQRMGDIMIVSPDPVSINTSECIEVIMFNGDPEIQLKTSVKEPDKSARDAMKYVPNMFDSGKVELKQTKKCRKMWYLEIKSSSIE